MGRRPARPGPGVADRPVGRRPQRQPRPRLPQHKRVSDADFELLVRNVYKVLLTRGLRGVYLHSTDAETQRFLERLVT